MNKFFFTFFLCLFSTYPTYARDMDTNRFIHSGVGGLYLEALESMFETAFDYCQEQNQYPILDSEIWVFDVGTFKAVRAYFYCEDNRNGI